MYYPGLVHETNTIKNTGVAPTDRHRNTLSKHLPPRSHTLSHSLAPFTALLSLSLSPPPLSASLSLFLLVCVPLTPPTQEEPRVTVLAAR